MKWLNGVLDLVYLPKYAQIGIEWMLQHFVIVDKMTRGILDGPSIIPSGSPLNSKHPCTTTVIFQPLVVSNGELILPINGKRN